MKWLFFSYIVAANQQFVNSEVNIVLKTAFFFLLVCGVQEIRCNMIAFIYVAASTLSDEQGICSCVLLQELRSTHEGWNTWSSVPEMMFDAGGLFPGRVSLPLKSKLGIALP